jgi:hypothetical protein
VLGFPLAVLYKFVDDQGSYLAALITYYGFLSLFPLLLLMTSVLGFVLGGDAHLQQRVLNSTLSQFPVIGSQLGDPKGLRGSGAGLVIGRLGAVYGGLGTSSVGLLVVTAASGVVSGLLLAGSRPLVGLGGQTVSPAGSVVLVGVSWASVLPSVLGFTALGVLLSVLSRNSVLGVGGPVVLGLVMTLLALVDGLGVTSHLLLTTPLFAWHGLWQPAATVAPVWQGVLVSSAYVALCLPVAARAFLRRDITGA